MKKLFITTLLMVIAFGSFGAAVITAKAADHIYCPGSGQVFGYWGTISPSTRLCSTTYYTWNSLTLGSEESWFFSDPVYLSCQKSTPPLGPTYYDSLGTSANIPAPDSSQTHSAHYYRWQDSTHWSLLGTVDQYNTFGWATLAATTWSFTDRLKLSDWTNESTKYSKHVDLDAFKFTNCP